MMRCRSGSDCWARHEKRRKRKPVDLHHSQSMLSDRNQSTKFYEYSNLAETLEIARASYSSFRRHDRETSQLNRNATTAIALFEFDVNSIAATRFH